MGVMCKMADANIEIGGLEFIAEELTADQSQPSREVVTTKIFNGTAFVTQGDYLPMSWSFKVYKEYTTGDEWNGMIKYLESAPMTVICPYIGDNFTAAVRITRNIESAKLMCLEFKLTEIPDTTNYTVDNSLYKYKHLTIQEVHDSEAGN